MLDWLKNITKEHPEFYKEYISQFEKNSSPAIKIVWITNGQKVFYVEIEGINQIITLRAEMKGKIGSGTLMDYINKQ